MKAWTDTKMACIYAGFLALMPLLAVVSPRALAGLPGFIGLAFFIMQAFRQRALPAIDKASLFLTAAILGLSLCSALWALDPAEVMDRTLKTAPVLLGLILMISAARSMDIEGLRRGITILPLVLGLASLLMLGEYLMNYPLYRVLNGIAPTAKINPSLLNRGIITLALCLFPGLCAIACGGHNKHRLYYGATLSLAVIAGSILSASQSAQMGLAVGFACCALFPANQKWAWGFLKASLILYLFSAPWLAHAAYMYADTVNASHYFGNGGAYGAQRLEIWHFVSERIFQHPLLGYGTEAARVMTFTTQERFFDSDTVLHPHNFVMQIWLEFGLFGIILCCVMLGWMIWMIRNIEPCPRRFILPCFAMTLFIGSTAYGMWQGWWLGLLTLLAVYILVLDRTQPRDIVAP